MMENNININMNELEKIQSITNNNLQIKTVMSRYFTDIIARSDQFKNIIATNESMKLISASLQPVVENTKLFQQINKNVFYDYINLNNELIASIQNSVQTEELIKLKKSIVANTAFSGLNEYIKSFKKHTISVPNLAVLKLNTELFNCARETLPYGLKSIIKEMHVGTASRLSSVRDIFFDSSKKVFISDSSDEEKEDSIATVSEMNLICSANDVFEDLTESELIEFMNYIPANICFAGSHQIGLKIYEIIKHWKDKTGFDNDHYFHGRVLPNDQAPYMGEEMLRAPFGVTYHGRFNFPGESNYYFSDQKHGVKIELRKHNKSSNSRIQMVKLLPKDKITLINISDKNKGGKFLEYCRYQLPDNVQIGSLYKEYLIPSYVASCCKQMEIDGIKYYGSKEYSNYVTWKDNIFNLAENEIITE